MPECYLFSVNSVYLCTSHGAFPQLFRIAECISWVAPAPSVTASRATFLPEEGLERVLLRRVLETFLVPTAKPGEGACGAGMLLILCK